MRYQAALRPDVPIRLYREIPSGACASQVQPMCRTSRGKPDHPSDCPAHGPSSMLQSKGNVAAIVQWQNACLWHRMSRVRSPLAAPVYPTRRDALLLIAPHG